MKKHLTLLLAAMLLPAAPALAAEGWIDVTSGYVTNPSFAGNSNAGWTIESNASSRTVRCECQEFWNGTFDIHQTLHGLPAGTYRVTFNGYYRMGDNGESYAAYVGGQETIPAVVYAGDATQQLVSVYSQHFSENLAGGCWSTWDDASFDIVYFPNTMESAHAAFEQQAYTNTFEFTTNGGDVELGLRTTESRHSNWCIFDNFRLERYGEVVPVASIALDADTLALLVGETRQVVATVMPSDATLRTLSWSSSDAGVATVDALGRVKAVGEGGAIITATATDGSGTSARCAVTVRRGRVSAGDLVVNEVMAANVDGWLSPSWNFDGWAELYNPTDHTVPMGGLFFTDDPAEKRKWQSPDDLGFIPAHGFGVVWFDNNGIFLPNDGSHANTFCTTNAPFKLDVDGGSLLIFNADGDEVARATWPAARQRVSYARTTDGGDTWGETADATPGASNAGAAFATAQVAAPVVDTPSQLFTGTLTVHVDVPSGQTLYYTTDGSLPTKSNGRHTTYGRFAVTKTTNYRFRLYQDGLLPSDAVTCSYILADQGYTLPIVSVVTDSRFLYDDSIGVYVRGVNGRPGNGQSSPCNWNMDWERPANFSYLGTDGQQLFNQDVDLEMAGGWSRAWTPHSFKLKGAKEYGGNKNLPYPFFATKPYIRNRTLQLRNGGNDTQCRFMDPALMSIFTTSGIDIDAQAYQPVHEFVNGQYIGVLNMREPNNKHYVYANYGWDDDEIDQFEMSPDSGYVQKCGTPEAFERLVEMSADAASPGTYEEIKQLLDIDEYVNYMAMELYLGSQDWPQNNVKGFAKRDGGRFRFVSFDLDGALSTTNSFQNLAGKQQYTFDQLYPGGGRHSEEIRFVTLFLNLLQNRDFRRQFIDTYCVMGGSVFEPQRVNAIVDSLVDRVAPAMSLEGASPLSTANSIKSGLATRNTTMTGTLQNFSQMQLSGTSRQQAALSSDVEGARLSVNGVEIPTGRFDGWLFPPVRLRAEAPAGYAFQGWLDASGAEETVFGKGQTWAYYDQGSLDGTGWNQPSFDAASWQTGRAPLGFGMDGVATTVSYGGNSRNKYPTTYFRRTFDLQDDLSGYQSFVLDYAVDDGFVVYVNGQEGGRYNMPSGDIGYSTYTTTYMGSTPGEGRMTLAASLFRNGSNTIAVEVHQSSATSSDLYWDVALGAVRKPDSDAGYYSTDSEIDLPTGNVSLTACYRAMDGAELSDSAFTPVRVNEVSAANDSYVSDYFKKSDWVELYNTTAATQDVEGMYLTDDYQNLHKSVLTKGGSNAVTTIPAHGYLIVWCDKKEPVNGLHAGFKLSAGGGEVALTAADDSWTDRLSYPAHTADETVGRWPDGGNSVYRMSLPTIGRQNKLTSYAQFITSEVVSGLSATAVDGGNAPVLRYVDGTLLVRADAPAVAVTIYTGDGRQVAVANVNLHEGEGYVPTRQLQPGFYVARATDGRRQASCKFVKR